MLSYIKAVVRSFLHRNLMLKFPFFSIGKKKALIIYTIDPFITTKLSHSNKNEIIEIVKLMRLKNIQVHLVHSKYSRTLKSDDYILILGFGAPYSRLVSSKMCKAIKIFYSTGAYPAYQNAAEKNRVNSVTRVCGRTLTPKRLCDESQVQFAKSDFIYQLGNGWTASTFPKILRNKIRLLPATALSPKGLLNSSRFGYRHKNRFVWIGSLGSVHKGLDLVLPYFKENSDCELFILGNLDADFRAVFSNLLNLPNVYSLGHLDVNSNGFIEACLTSRFLILPSCSEGQSTSVLTGMGFGLVPIVSQMCGVDIEACGIEIKELSIDCVVKSLHHARSLDEKELEHRSWLARDAVENRHGIKFFSNQFHKHLDEAMLKHNVVK